MLHGVVQEGRTAFVRNLDVESELLHDQSNVVKLPFFGQLLQGVIRHVLKDSTGHGRDSLVQIRHLDTQGQHIHSFYRVL